MNNVAVLVRSFARRVWVTVAMASVSLPASEIMAQQLGFSAPKAKPVILVAASQPQASAPTCKRSPVRVIGQLAAGVWCLDRRHRAYHTVYQLDPSETKVDGDAGYKPNANTAFAIGSWVGSTALIFVAGRPACGSLGMTAVGTGLPSAVLLLGRDQGYLPIIGALLVAPVQSLGGTLMFPKR